MHWIFLKTNPFISSPVSKILVYANVFVSICAAAQVFVTYMFFGLPVTFNNNAFLLFVFLSTYLQYNLQRGYFIQKVNLHTESSEWIKKHQQKIFYSTVACLIGVLFLCNNLSNFSIGIMVGAELISTAYYLPPFNLRKYGYIKPLVISSIWVVSCSAVPLIENQLLNTNALWFLLSQFFFTSVLSVLFDVKDTTDDFLNGISTYSNTIGERGAKALCVVLITATFVCFLFTKHSVNALVAESVLLLVTLITVFITHEKKHRFYFYLWVDGLLLLQAILFYVFLSINSF